MIDKLINFCKENPYIEYIVISWEDWGRLCNEIREKKDGNYEADSIWDIYWQNLFRDIPTFGRIKILIKDKVAIL